MSALPLPQDNIEIKKGLTLKDKVRGPELITDDNKKD